MEEKIKLLQAMRDKCASEEEREILNECIGLFCSTCVCDYARISLENAPQLYADDNIYEIPKREIIFEFSDGLRKIATNIAFSPLLWDEIRAYAKGDKAERSQEDDEQ